MKLFKNALIVDGSGASPYPGSLRVQDDQIVEVSAVALENIEGEEVIDLEGAILAPGFIDSHSHNDWFCLREDKADFFDPFLSQGITTMVTGNCGFSATGFNADSPHLEHLGGELFNLEEDQKHARCEKWLEKVHHNTSINITTLLGHGTARLTVSGLNQGKLTPEQEESMLEILEQGLKDGAAGISLGLMYLPGIFAPYEELLKVAKLCAKYDRILTIHPRAESAISLSYTTFKKSHLLLALEEVLNLAKESGCRTIYSHLIFVGRRSWKDVDEALKNLEALHEEGDRVGFDMYPFNYGASVITVILPDWYQKMSLENRRSPLVKLRLRLMVMLTSRLLGFGFDDIRVAYAGAKNESFNGMTITEIAKNIKRSPFDTYLKICEESDFKARVLMGSYQNEAIVRRLMQHPLSVYMTDAWYEKHGMQNEAIYKSFPEFLKRGSTYGMPLEDIIHRMSGKTAERYQLEKRGLLRSGYYADLVVLDPEELNVRQVFVNGKLAFDQGEFTKERNTYGQSLPITSRPRA